MAGVWPPDWAAIDLVCFDLLDGCGLTADGTGADEPVLPCGADGSATMGLLAPGCADWNAVLVLLMSCMAVTTALRGPAGRLDMGAKGAATPSCDTDGTAWTGRGGCRLLLSFFFNCSLSPCCVGLGLAMS